MNLEAADLIPTELADSGFVAAGRSVLPFPTPESTTIVPLTPQQAKLAAKGLIQTMTVYGPSLERVGIFDSDKVIVQKAVSRKQIGRDTICIVYIPSSGEVVGKKLVFLGKEVLLKSCNRNVPDIYIEADSIDIRGIVIGLYRPPDSFGRFDRGYNDFSDIPL